MPIFDVGVSQNRTDELIRQAVAAERQKIADWIASFGETWGDCTPACVALDLRSRK